MGLVASIALHFLLVQNIKTKSYADGYNSGNAKGLSDGTAFGRTEQKRYDDSLCLEIQAKLMLPKPAKKKVATPKPVRYDINYKMNGNEVGEEIK